MNNVNLNDIAWENLFDKYEILSNIEKEGIYKISADKIKEFREPRLMVKFDHTRDLPKLFYENQLSILPITRGDYLISHFDAYHKFESDNSDVILKPLPEHIQSLNISNITSESIALNCAFVSGIIADFMGDDEVVPTVSGRMGTGDFSFEINDTQNKNYHTVNVNNSQIEIDAAYEGINSLTLFEAKREISDDFLIRQLYYPFRVWEKRITKPVKTVFLIYSNGMYRIYEYQFEDIKKYNSLRLVKQQTYSIENPHISIEDIQSVLQQTSINIEPNVPFPQADKFERVINLCELLSTQDMSRTNVTELYAFDSRQTNYYADAARYLGLIDKTQAKGKTRYSISKTGKNILNLKFREKQLSYCGLILSHKTFHKTLEIYLNEGKMPSDSEIIRIMKNSGLYKVESDSTFERRSSTVKGWINWIISLITIE